MPDISPISIFHQTITNLILTREPAFIAIALYWMDRFAIVLIVYEALKGAGSSGAFQDRWFSLMQTLMFVVFARTLLVFYDTPFLGIVSFSNLITDQAAYLVNLLDTNSLEAMHANLDLIWVRIAEPSYLAIFPLIVYLVLLAIIFFAKMISIFVLAYGYVASAVCGLLGPLFIPFLIWKPMSWMFWGWLKAFIQYSFVPVVAMAFLTVFGQFIARVATVMPTCAGGVACVSVADYPVYVYTAIVMIGTMAIGIATVPGLTGSLFSGHLHQGGTAGGMVAGLLMRR